MLFGGFLIFIGCLFLVIYFVSGCEFISKNVRRHNLSHSKSKQHSWYYNCLFLSSVFLFGSLFLITAGVGVGFFALFIVEYLGWSAYHGAYITSIYWGALCCGRLLGIPLSVWVSSHKRLCINLFMTCAAFGVMLFIHQLGNYEMYIGVVIAGIASSTISANFLLWSSTKCNTANGPVAAFSAGTSSGIIVGYYSIGKLVQIFNLMWLIYSLFYVVSILIILLVFIQILVKCCYSYLPIGENK